MKFIILLLTGFFSLSTISNHNFTTLETVASDQLYLDMVQEFDIIDEVQSIKLIQDKEGIFLYDVEGQKDGNAVSFKVEISQEEAVSHKIQYCTCNTDYRARSWEDYRWKCNLWCW